MAKPHFIFFCLAALLPLLIPAQVKGTLTAPDSVVITYDEYIVSKKAPLILLCHQAGYSRGEYIETAKKLNKEGFNCIAIDQRSGDACNNVINETKRDALAKGKKTSYGDAETDIQCALDFFYKKYKRRIILWGSSYSASIALKIGKKNAEKLKAIIAFSPGEYLENVSVEDETRTLGIFCIIYCSKNELEAVSKCTSGIINKKTFRSLGQGRHGSSVLWSDCSDSLEYWGDLFNNLNSLKY